MGKVKLEIMNMHEALQGVVLRLEKGLDEDIPADVVLDNIIDYLTDNGYMDEVECACGDGCCQEVSVEREDE